MLSASWRSTRSRSSDSPSRRLPSRDSARSYSGPNRSRSWSVRRLRVAAHAMSATTITIAAMITTHSQVGICIPPVQRGVPTLRDRETFRCEQPRRVAAGTRCCRSGCYGPDVLPPSQPLRRTSGLATALVALLAAQIALIAAEIVARYVQADVLRDLQATGSVTQHTLDTADGWVSGTAAIDGLVFVAAVVVWCVWQHHAQANAVVLSGGGLRFTPGWAVGWWFIPIANLWKPFQTVRELWRASHGGG